MRLATHAGVDITINADEKLNAQLAQTNPDEVMSQVTIGTTWNDVVVTTYRNGTCLTEVKPRDLGVVKTHGARDGYGWIRAGYTFQED